MHPDGKKFIRDRIISAIRRKGRISYRELQETLLYEPEHGFYTRYLRIGTGAGHHFSTRPIVQSPFYGMAFARKLKRFIRLLELDAERIDLVALGDGTGVFFQDTLSELRRHPALYARLRKTSVELVPRFVTSQERRLAGHGVTIINDSALEIDRYLKPLEGIFFANELFDQLPVHRVVRRGGVVYERYITLEGNRFREIDGMISDPALVEYFSITGKPPRSGRPCVVNLDAMKLLRKISQLLTRGAAFIIDYTTRKDLRLNTIPYARFGKNVPLKAQTIEEAIGRDVTTDVDFKALKLIARHFGLRVLFEEEDSEFLYSMAAPQPRGALGYPIRVLALARR